MSEEESSTFETRKDAGDGGRGAYRLWMAALDLADKTEKDWRKRAQAAVDRYRDEHKGEKDVSRFNILYSSVQTQEPAMYNSTPVPDVRRRFGDDDPVGKAVADVYERVLSCNLDTGAFDETMADSVHDALLPGRGVAYVTYNPVMGDNDEVAHETVGLEHVQWDDFRRGPGKRWTDVPWVAVRYRITRDEAIELSPKYGPTVSLDHVETGKDDAPKDVPDTFKRLTVWKIWDKAKRQIVFIAPSFKDGPFAVEDDQLNLEGFFPFPRPIYDVSESTSLVPIVPFDMYRAQADELDTLTRRITALVKVCKWRGMAPGQIEELSQLVDAADGEIIASQSATAAMAASQAGGIDKLFWLMPIDKLIVVIRELVAQREQVKQVVFEISGLADIMRGETNPNETLGAQQIKAQWGSMRMQARQREVQRFARDAIRMMAEVVGEHFSIQTLQMATGMKLPSAEEKAAAQVALQQDPQAAQKAPPEMVEYLQKPTWDEVKQVMSSDAMRSYRVDIETDSTITADQTRAQQNMATFIEGLASFGQAVGPGIEAGIIPIDVATDILSGFARNFQLGKKAEDAIERMGESKKQGPDPQVQAQMQQMQAQMQEATQRAEQAEQALQQAQGDQQAKQADIALKQQDGQRKAEMDGYELQRKAMADQATAEREARKLALEEQRFEFDRWVKETELAAANDATQAEAATGSQIAATMQAATEVATATAEAAQATGESLTQAAQSLAVAAQQMAEMSARPRTAKIVRGPNGEKMAVSEIG